MSNEPKLFLGVDQGSSSTKGIVIDSAGAALFETSVPVATQFLDEKRVEQDPNELCGSVKTCLDNAILWAEKEKRSVTAIGISCQRSGVLSWSNKTGKILHPLISWRDTRTAEFLERKGENLKSISERTGLPVTPHYAGGKISLLQKEFKGAEDLVGLLDSYLMRELTKSAAFTVEETFAARTMLYNLEKRAWDEELCALLDVEMKRLPKVIPSFSDHGRYRSIPISAVLGDQQAALYGMYEGTRDPFIVLGTLGAVLVPTGDAPLRVPGFITSILFSSEAPLKGKGEVQYLIEASTHCCGPTIDFILEKEKLCGTPSEIDALCLGASREKRPTAYFPLNGTGSPEWKADLPNVITGWDGKDKAIFVRALMENLGCAVSENVETLSEKAGTSKNSRIKVTGGVSKSDYLLQFIADVTGFELQRMESEKGSAYGAAAAAAASSGLRMRFNEGQSKSFIPKANSAAKESFSRWKLLRDRVFRGEVSEGEIYLR